MCTQRTFATSLLLALSLLLTIVTAQAEEFIVRPLTKIDKDYLALHTDRLDELIRRHYGRQLQGNPENDLELLQLVADSKLIPQDDTPLLQAMGYILGDLLREKYQLRWVVYIDKLGRTRALEEPRTKTYIFPTTLISRRLAVGATADVKKIYSDTEAIVRKQNPWFSNN